MARQSPERQQLIAYVRSLVAPVPRRILPPRDRQVVSFATVLRGVFMFRPRFACTICGSEHVRPSSSPLPRMARVFGLAAYRCIECDYLLALPFRS